MTRRISRRLDFTGRQEASSRRRARAGMASLSRLSFGRRHWAATTSVLTSGFVRSSTPHTHRHQRHLEGHGGISPSVPIQEMGPIQGPPPPPYIFIYSLLAGIFFTYDFFAATRDIALRRRIVKQNDRFRTHVPEKFPCGAVIRSYDLIVSDDICSASQSVRIASLIAAQKLLAI